MKKTNKLSALKEQLQYKGKRSAGAVQVGGEVKPLRKKRTKLARRKLTGRERLVLLIPAAAAVAAVVIVVFTVGRGSTYEFSDSGYQYYAGSAARVEAGAKMKRSDEGAVFDIPSAQPTTLPVYLDSSRSMVLTTDMCYYGPRSVMRARAVCFTEIQCNPDGVVTAVYDGKKANPETGFLYDGKDFYIFLEPIKVQVHGRTIELPPLSYAEVINGGHVMLFNYETKDVFLEMLDGNVTAEPLYGGYSISLLGDSMIDHREVQFLLTSRADLYDPVV